jgi:anti-anti-sigma factor
VPDPPLLTTFDEDARVLAVSGDTGGESTETLRQLIEAHSLGFSTDLVVDLTGVTYLPSVAIGMLVRVGESCKASGAVLELAARAGSPAQRVLTVSAMPFRSY